MQGKEQDLVAMLRQAADQLEDREESQVEYVHAMYLPQIGNVREFYMGNMDWVKQNPLGTLNAFKVNKNPRFGL